MDQYCSSLYKSMISKSLNSCLLDLSILKISAQSCLSSPGTLVKGPVSLIWMLENFFFLLCKITKYFYISKKVRSAMWANLYPKRSRKVIFLYKKLVNALKITTNMFTKILNLKRYNIIITRYPPPPH